MDTGNDGKGKCKFKHFTLDKRYKLLDLVREGERQKIIADQLKMSITSISRELKRNRTLKRSRPLRNVCQKVKNCTIKGLCTNMLCHTLCKNCIYDKQCIDICPLYEERQCKRLERFPYVCDGCENARGCPLKQYRYIPEEANKKAQTVLVETRCGINMTEEEFASIDHILSLGVAKNQSIEHISASNEFPVTSRTIRNYVQKGLTTISHEDMPRGVAYKPRHVHISKEQQKQSRLAKQERGYPDFLKYANSHVMMTYTQMDTVEGSKAPGDVARLSTFICPSLRLFICFPMPDGKMESLVRVIDKLYTTLGNEDYSLLFSVLLTDNGTEFFDPWSIETDKSSGIIRSHVFYCHPYSSWEKGAIENCHTLLRRIIPKGTTLKYVTEEDCYIINSHINSYIRSENGNMSAYDTMVKVYESRGERILKKLKITRISPSEVELSPALLHKKAL